MEQVRIYLSRDEYTGLVKLCELELRSLPDQIRQIVRRELQRRKLLPGEHKREGKEVTPCQ